MAKVLYVTDLDGTLLKSDETTSEYTNKTINALIEKGMIFSYATARSYYTSHKVASGIKTPFPVINYNGTMITDEKGNTIIKNFFGEEIKDVIKELLKNDIYPIVYSFINSAEKFSYNFEKSSEGLKEFILTRRDERSRNVCSDEELLDGEIFHITCIDEKEKLELLFEKFKEKYHCLCYVDFYSKRQWLEIMPETVSKGYAVTQLKEYLGCDKVVVFGDAGNDKDMFSVADECYAVENAVEDLKKIATGVIGNNNADGVAKFLEKNAEF